MQVMSVIIISDNVTITWLLDKGNSFSGTQSMLIQKLGPSQTRRDKTWVDKNKSSQLNECS